MDFYQSKTSRGRLDTHLLYVDVFMKSYVYYDDAIDVEENIFK